MPPVAPWHPTRPTRNQNPGDLRPRRAYPPWPGQSGVDTAPGGPFAIFATPADGWCALGLWCLDARYLRGLTTARTMIAVFAPPDDNNPTASYADGVARTVGNGDLDLTDAVTLLALMRAIARWEDRTAPWSDADIQTGMHLCVQRWPAYKAARTHAAPPVAPPADKPLPPVQEASLTDADRLNQGQIDRLKGTQA